MKINKIEVKSFNFSGGEVQIKLPLKELGNPSILHVETILDSSDKIMELLLVKNAIDKCLPDADTVLDIAYLPYARQDRHCAKGEAHSKQVMIDLLRGAKFDTIRVVDIHSQENELPLGIQNISQALSISLANITNIDALVAPDKGAAHKCSGVGKMLNLPVVYCSKVRDVETGALSSPIVNSCEAFIKDKTLLIVDDICDGGYTFIQLAKELEKFNPKSINLYVTHGIFSKGLEPLRKAGISRIITTDSLKQNDLTGLEVIKL